MKTNIYEKHLENTFFYLSIQINFDINKLRKAILISYIIYNSKMELSMINVVPPQNFKKPAFIPHIKITWLYIYTSPNGLHIC